MGAGMALIAWGEVGMVGNFFYAFNECIRGTERKRGGRRQGWWKYSLGKVNTELVVSGPPIQIKVLWVGVKGHGVRGAPQ